MVTYYGLMRKNNGIDQLRITDDESWAEPNARSVTVSGDGDIAGGGYGDGYGYGDSWGDGTGYGMSPDGTGVQVRTSRAPVSEI